MEASNNGGGLMMEILNQKNRSRHLECNVISLIYPARTETSQIESDLFLSLNQCCSNNSGVTGTCIHSRVQCPAMYCQCRL